MSVLDDYLPGGLNRTLCGVLDEMRALYKTCNFGALPGLIEEAQMMANRMEAALEDKDDYSIIRKQAVKARAELKVMRNELKLLNTIKEKT